jgi:hypothetical protein
MLLKALFISVALVVSASPSFAAEPAKADAAPAAAAKKVEKVELKADAAPEVKAALEAAGAANQAVVKAGFEWFMKEKSMSDLLQDAIKLANEDKTEDALKLAKTISKAAEAGMKQAEAAKTVAPRL